MDRSENVDRFLASLDRLDVGWSRATKETFGEAIGEVLSGPAVGSPLPFQGLSIQGMGIELNPTPGQLKTARTGVTAARIGVASYGALVLENGADATEAVSLFCDLHVAVLRAADVVPDMRRVFQRLGEAIRSHSTSAVLATGPSATADMGALVRGAHGPKAVHVVLVEDQ